jgi:hypothetical protein
MAGLVMGSPQMKDVENRLFASQLKCAIYSVDYRLAPEAPHPAPLEDIYSVFVWLHANAGQLGLDPARIGIKGESGGGGFAAAAALYARDRQGPKSPSGSRRRSGIHRACVKTVLSLQNRRPRECGAQGKCLKALDSRLRGNDGKGSGTGAHELFTRPPPVCDSQPSSAERLKLVV